jgi:hypothetical protein
MRSILLLTAAVSLFAQPPIRVQSPSSFAMEGKDDQKTVEITNAAFQLTGNGIPGRPSDERLVLRTVTQSKQFVGDIGEEALTTVDAWPFGADLQQKPLYTVQAAGEDVTVVEGELFTILRGLEEVEWWSVYKLGTGERLFDTYVPLLHFSIARDVETTRYAGLEVPEDDVADKRLRDPHVVAVLTYASAERVLREVLITSDDPKQAVMLRSFADATRTVTAVGSEPVRGLRLSISQNYPSAPATVTITIPIVKDELDLARAQAPLHVHLAAWKR